MLIILPDYDNLKNYIHENVEDKPFSKFIQ